MKSEKLLESKTKILQNSKLENFQKTSKLLSNPPISSNFSVNLKIHSKSNSFQDKAFQKELEDFEETIFQKEIEDLQEINSNLEKEIINLEKNQKEASFSCLQAEKQILLEEYNRNLNFQLQEMRKMNENRIILEQEFQKQKLEVNFQNIEKKLVCEGISRNEEEKLIFALENEFSMKFNFFLQEKEKDWISKKKEIEFEAEKYFAEKKSEYGEKLNKLIKREVDLWETEKTEKMRSLESFFEEKRENSKNIEELEFELKVKYFKKIKIFFCEEFRKRQK